MSKFIGGHQRRCERRIEPPRDTTRRCSFCHASLEHEAAWPHFCKEISYQTMPIMNFEPFEVT
jgi:hypothetical protein